MMRIAFDAKRAFHNKTGLGNYSRGVIDAVSKYDQANLILYTTANGKAFKNIPPSAKQINYNAPFSNAKRLLGPPKKHQLDIYHGLSNELPLIKSTKMVVTIHDLIFKSHPHFYKGIDRTIYNLKIKNAIKKADHIVCTSAQTLEHLRKEYKVTKQTSVIYQHSSWKEPSIGEPIITDKYYIYVSSFEQRKNHRVLIEAFNLIKNKTDKKLLLVGRLKESFNEVKDLVQKNGLTEKVILKTEAKLNEIQNYLKYASGFIYPSLIEGFGIPLIEAMHFSLPIAASNIPVFNEIGGDSIQYFDPLSSKEMSESILKLEELNFNKEKQNYVEKLQNFSIKKHSDQLIKLYKSL